MAESAFLANLSRLNALAIQRHTTLEEYLTAPKELLRVALSGIGIDCDELKEFVEFPVCVKSGKKSVWEELSCPLVLVWTMIEKAEK